MNNQLWIIDTDHVSLHQRNHPEVIARMAAMLPETLAVTIVTFEEQIRGRLAVVRRARNTASQTQAYALLQDTLIYFCARRVLPFDDAAATKFDALRPTLRRLSTQDLKIAAIALSVSGVLVTRNRADFEQVPNLTIEDWT